MVKLVEMENEPLASYREAVRRRLQELMLRENFHPGHPLVTSTSGHLDMSSAAEAAEQYSARSVADYYKGCDLFYTAPCPRVATPPSPDQKFSLPSMIKIPEKPQPKVTI